LLPGDPDDDLVFRLRLEVGLPFAVPRHHPRRVADGREAAGDLSTVESERVPLGDLLDIGGDLAVQRGQAGRRKGGLVRLGAEFVGPAEGGVLLGDVAPQRPDATFADIRVEGGWGMVVAPAGVLD